MRKRVNSMKVTISDVARLAGVSTATVSHTINNTRYVSNETKEKVYQAIAELGYTPDASARSFRTGKKKTIYTRKVRIKGGTPLDGQVVWAYTVVD